MIHEFANEKLTAAVKSLGAELTSIQSKDGFEYLWQGSEDSWKGQSPILFPIIGGLENDRYTLDGREYEMASHGFARKMEWMLLENAGQDDTGFVDSSTDSLVFELKSDDETRRQYPFDFRFLISYVLEESSLSVHYGIENLSEGEMPFSVGGHPGFRCPLEDGRCFEDYRLRFSRSENTVRFIKEGKLLTGETEAFELPDGILNLNHEIFKRGALIFRNFASESITLESDAGDRSVRLDFPGFTHLGIWTFPALPQPYICIEPWFGMDSTAGLNEDKNMRTKTGMQHLQPGDQFNSVYTITVN